MDVVHFFLYRTANQFLNKAKESMWVRKACVVVLPSMGPKREKYSRNCTSGKFGSTPPTNTLRLLFEREWEDNDDSWWFILVWARRRCAGLGSTLRPLTKCSFCERIFSTISFLSNTRKAKPRLRPVVGSCLIEQSRILPKLEKYSRKSSGVVSQVNPPASARRRSDSEREGERRATYQQIIFYHLRVWEYSDCSYRSYDYPASVMFDHHRDLNRMRSLKRDLPRPKSSMCEKEIFHGGNI